MAKKVDPFEKFKAATLGSSSELIDAINTKHTDEVETAKPETTVEPQPVQAAPVKVSKNADCELVSFHIAKDMKKKLAYLKCETDKSFGELYTEAISDLLKKYNKI